MSLDSLNAAFLLDCCRVKPPAEAGWRDDRARLDFGLIAETAQRHGIIPLVARRLAALSDGAREDPAVRRILRHADAFALRNQYMVEQLAIVIERFKRAGIETLLIKGPALARLAYQDVSLRPFGDLDLVVRPGDVPRAARELDALGFGSSLYDQEAFTSGFFDAVEANFHRGEDQVNIDLHWDLMPPAFALGPSGEAIWKHAGVIDLNGTSIRTLSNEDHMLYLTAHSARHGWVSLGQVCDVAYFATQVPINWAALFELAKETHCRRILAVALWLAHELIGTPLPSRAGALIDPEDPAPGLARLIGHELAADERAGSITCLRRTVSLMDRPVDRLRYLVIGAFAPTLMDRRFAHLPRWLYPAYFLVRPIRLALETLRRKGLIADEG